MANEHKVASTVTVYTRSISICLNFWPGQTFNQMLGFLQPSTKCLDLGFTLKAMTLIEISSRTVYMLLNNCMATDIKVPKASPRGWPISHTFHDFKLTIPIIGPIQ